MTLVGTHNLHDHTGDATGFAKVICFTEAIPDLVMDQLPTHYVTAVARWQKDLIIAWDPNYFKPELDKKGRVKRFYKLNNPGVAKVTPHRGTFWIKGEMLVMGFWKKTAVICAHWINAAHPPYKRGEKWLRRRWWKKQQKFTKKLVRRLMKQGYEIVGAGDLNVAYREQAFEWMRQIHEVGHGYDRIFSTYELTNVRYLAKKGSDHPRLVADAA